MNSVTFFGGNTPFAGSIIKLLSLKFAISKVSYGLSEWNTAQWYFTDTVVLFSIDIVLTYSTFGIDESNIIFLNKWASSLFIF